PVPGAAVIYSRRLHARQGPAHGRKFLFVGGPFGPFSAALARRLRASGANAQRVITNGGDLWDWGVDDALLFLKPRDEFSIWLLAQLKTHEISDLVTFGDTTFYVRAAIEQANKLGVRAHVFEEGYFRPHWITLERGGVNGHSSLPRDPAFYQAA